MRLLFTLLLMSWSITAFTQNVDYNSRITQFYGNCNESGTEEYTWYGYLSDNIVTAETSSGCIQRNNNGAVTQYGSYATRNRTNSTATQLRARIDSWEDDNGGRCDYRTGTFLNNDDCRTQRTCYYNFTNPLEYQYTSITSPTCGSGEGNMRTFYQYRYSTTTLSAATEYTASTLSTGGNRGFWGSRGSWANVGADCATSGTITNNQTSSFRTTVDCKRSVTFLWKTSSQTNSDWLEVYVNGVRKDRISGIRNWATKTITLDRNRSNIVEWRYVKDGSGSSGEDRGFVDQISFASATSTDLIPGSINNTTREICTGGNPANIASTAAASAYSATLTYQWQQSPNLSTWSNISGATGISYDPPANLTQTRHYRRRVIDGCGFIKYTQSATYLVNPLPNGNLVGTPSVCAGSSTNIVFNGTAGSSPWDITYNGTVRNNIPTNTNLSVSPIINTTYTLSRIEDNKGCVRTTGLGTTATVNVNTLSTTPNIVGISGKQCPNITHTLTASGGTAGTGAITRWYTGANGTGTLVGTGNSIAVSPSTTTTYYARREGTCNTTGDRTTTITIKDYIYAPIGNTASVGFCTDNAGWNHFFDANDDIVLSVRGDMSGAVGTPTATISNNGTSYQQNQGPFLPTSCAFSNLTPGEQRFEMPRSWNLDFVGTLNPPYEVRYYFPIAEKIAIEAAAAAHIAAYPACGYTYKSPNPNGFVWFKNVGTAYTAPSYGVGGVELTATSGNVGSINYATMSGVTSFSGGTGEVTVVPRSSLPVELVNFDGEHQKNKNFLHWATSSETNNSHFLLQRTSNASTAFETIATIQGAGTTTNSQYYDYVDAAPLLGVNYYRLVQVDFDGSIEYSSTIAIEVAAKGGDYVFYPNPTTDKVTYQFNSIATQDITIQVTNALGQVLQTNVYATTKGINSIALDLASYPAGAYVVQVLQLDGKIMATEKIMKQAD